MYPIVHKRVLTPVTNLFEVEAPLVARAAQPGQFVILRVNKFGERIPISIADANPDKGVVTIVVQQVGRTSTLVNQLEEGDSLLDLAGPLGETVHHIESGHIACIGGGFGAAPMWMILKGCLKNEKIRTSAIVGARNAELLILTDELKQATDQLHLCTDDGSHGFKGFVTQKIEALLAKGETIDELLAVGPMPMMRAVAGLGKKHGIRTQVSLDPIMVDGTGMCGGCRVSIGGETRFACVDGPFFEASGVDFDELVRRNVAYVTEEAEAAAKNPNCKRLEGAEAQEAGGKDRATHS